MEIQRETGIRDQGGGHNGVGVPTVVAEDPGNPQRDGPVRQGHLTGIGTIPDQGAGMAARAGKDRQVKRENHLVIKILRKGVVQIGFNCYHGNWTRGRQRPLPVFCGGSGKRTLVGEVPASCLRQQFPIITQKAPGAKNPPENPLDSFALGLYLFCWFSMKKV